MNCVDYEYPANIGWVKSRNFSPDNLAINKALIKHTKLIKICCSKDETHTFRRDHSWSWTESGNFNLVGSYKMA